MVVTITAAGAIGTAIRDRDNARAETADALDIG
jgi:hypothetical protein